MAGSTLATISAVVRAGDLRAVATQLGGKREREGEAGLLGEKWFLGKINGPLENRWEV